MNKQLDLDTQKQQQIKRFCERWNIEQMELFGSILGTFSRPDERIKVLLTFGPDAAPTLGDRMNMELGLQKIFSINRQVDLYSHSGVDRDIISSHRDNILNEESLLVFPLPEVEEETISE